MFFLFTTLSLCGLSAAFQIFPPDTVSSYPAACGAILSQNITACNSLVAVLDSGSTYDRATLDQSCTSSCNTALVSWYSDASRACGNVTFASQYGTTQYISSILGEIGFNFNQTCLKHDGEYCNLVLGNLTASNVPSVPTCNYCALLQIKATAESPYGDGPLVYSESIYQSYTKSCSYSGIPLATSTMAATKTSNITRASTPSNIAKASTPSNISKASTHLWTSPTATPKSCNNGTKYDIKYGDTCNSVASAQGTATWWLLLDNGLQSHCANFPKNSSICIQHPCRTLEIKSGDTCRTVASANNITVTQLRTWNPWISPGCYNFNDTIGTHLCVDQPGKKYSAPTAPIGSPSVASNAVSVPPDIASNTTTQCGLYYRTKAGDYCDQLVLKFGIEMSDFLILNPGVNSNCTNLYADESYCVAPVGDISDYPGSPFYSLEHPNVTAPCFTTLPSATYIPLLPLTTYQLAAGTDASCRNYANGVDLIYNYAAVSDCSAAAWQFNVTLDQLHKWNPTLQTASTSCTFNAHLRYCVWRGEMATSTGSRISKTMPSIISTSKFAQSSTTFTLASSQSTATQSTLASASIATLEPSRSTASVSQTTLSPAPSPTQDHSIARNCKSYDKVSSGEGCSDFATNHHITPSQLYNWNSVLGVDGANCSSLLELGVYYCVSVNVPEPVQNNSIPANCDVYSAAQDGEACSNFAKRNNVTTNDLYEWNSVLGQDGADCETQFQAGMFYCVGTNGHLSTA